MMNPAAVLALLGSLYEQLVAATQRVQELEAALAVARAGSPVEKEEPQ
jgi:hypothetical protein